jgi:hypothetical protein
VILHCNFEELRALAAAVELMMMAEAGHSSDGFHASPEDLAEAERLLPRLIGDMSIETLDDQRHVQEAVSTICRLLLNRLDAKVVEYHPGHEEAVALYFDYGHSRVVLDRLTRMGTEMEAIIDLMGGGRPTADLASSVTFPD